MIAAKEKEIIEWTSRENLRHMQQRNTLSMLIDQVLEDLPEKEGEVRAMTPFQQIGFLEEVSNNRYLRERIVPVTGASISHFLVYVRPYKRGFWSTEDQARGV